MSKRYFSINPVEEPDKYRIFKQLMSMDRQVYIVNNVSEKDWYKSVSKSIGRECKNVTIDGDRVIMPPATNGRQDIAYIVKKPGIIFEEKKLNKISLFFPKKLSEL